MADDVRERVLQAVAKNDITFRHGKTRWWLTEDEYRLLTRAERKHLHALRSDGLIQPVRGGGHPHGIGFYELTYEGRKASR